MPRTSVLMLLLLPFVLAACNKSSPPPQKPVTPRSLVQLEPLAWAAH